MALFPAYSGEVSKNRTNQHKQLSACSDNGMSWSPLSRRERMTPCRRLLSRLITKTHLNFKKSVSPFKKVTPSIYGVQITRNQELYLLSFVQ
ncbi:hypothetical protein E2C01_078271 [Portunus trituberculatus]|uniref:Uncharacterized protein n=1 Tax=Portunus trituberculatus TaxID=210409 RepID=A0A5B7INE2_PORTR|nr:hypothetical protein [Portunus trituberculatus]